MLLILEKQTVNWAKFIGHERRIENVHQNKIDRVVTDYESIEKKPKIFIQKIRTDYFSHYVNVKSDSTSNQIGNPPVLTLSDCQRGDF